MSHDFVRPPKASLQHQHGARRACRVLLLVVIGGIGCTGPNVTYGEHAVLRPKTTPMSAGGTGGAIDQAGTSDAGGVLEQPHPDDMLPDDEPEPITDAGSIDAGVPVPTSDASVILEVTDAPLCEMIPLGLLEPTTEGVGLESGCAQQECIGNGSIDMLDLNGLGIALEVYDPSVLRGCTAVFGDVVVHNYSGEDLSALSCLEVISGSLLILGAPSLASLDGLEHLQYVTGGVSLGHAESYASDIRALADIRGLSQLHVVLDSLAIHAPMLTSLHGLEGLRAIVGSFELGAAALYDLTGLDALRAIGGDFVISGATGLRSFSGADELEMIGGSFHLGSSPNLRAFDGALASVACVGGHITVQGPNPALEELDLMPALRSVGGDVSVHGNERLQSITMLSNVENVGGSIAIQDNGALAQVDLSSLENLGGVMVVLDNPQLEECPLVELADALGRSAGSQITGNARTLSTECSVLEPP